MTLATQSGVLAIDRIRATSESTPTVEQVAESDEPRRLEMHPAAPSRPLMQHSSSRNSKYNKPDSSIPLAVRRKNAVCVVESVRDS
jgi:hypothetical protein